MSTAPMPQILILFTFLASCWSSCAETLRAADVIGPTNTDWMAFARAHRSAQREESVKFLWMDHPAASYAEIRRALWLAALHGLTDQTGDDGDTRRLMEGELKAARQRLRTPFAFDVAVRDTSSADRLLPLLIDAQSACLLIGEDESTALTTVLRCKGKEVQGEKSGVTFTSLPMAVTFIQACNTDKGLVFEEDGRVAKEVFVRRFRDNSATVVNLTSATRRGLTYRHGLTCKTFDLTPAGVIHVLQADPDRLSRDFGEVFSTGLWQVRFEGDVPPRLIDKSRLPSVVAETYRGIIRYQTTVIVPPGETLLLLNVDTDGSETEVFIGGISLGTRAWEPFEWPMPRDSRGRNVPIEIRVRKRTIGGCLQSVPTWHRR